MSTYGKTNLIDDLTANTSGVTKREIAMVLDAALDLIQNQVRQGNTVTIPGFGSWQQTQRSARVGTNIRTKQKIQIPASTSVRFTPGTTFKNAVSGKASNRRAASRSGASYANERAASQATAGQTPPGTGQARERGRNVPAR